MLDLEGLWTRYEDPEPLLAEIATVCGGRGSPRRMQEIYAAPIQPDLVAARIAEVRAAGVTAAARCRRSGPPSSGRPSSTPASTCSSSAARRSPPSTSRGRAEPLNLKQFIYELDVPVIVGGCATYQAALHLMRTGAAGVLVGFGGGAAHTTRDVLGVARADGVRGRRRRSGAPRLPRRVAAAATSTSSPTAASVARGDIAKAVACGADAVMMGSPLARAAEAPGRGWHWGSEAHHAELPRGERVQRRHGRHARGDPARPVPVIRTAR